jgi:MFS family permease
LSPPPTESGSEQLRSPLALRNFRYQWCADLFTSCSFEMETIILGWYVLVETGSVLMLTVLGALQFIGTLVAPILGVVGDRIGQRNLLSGMRAVYATVAAILTALAFTGGLNPPLVLVRLWLRKSYPTSSSPPLPASRAPPPTPPA